MTKRIAVVVLVLLPILIFAARQVPAQDSAESTRKVVNRVDPQYPGMAKSINLQGSVKLDVLVSPNGTVKSVAVKGGHPLLAQAAQDALRQWKWEAAAHETHESVELKFSLHDR